MKSGLTDLGKAALATWIKETQPGGVSSIERAIASRKPVEARTEQSPQQAPQDPKDTEGAP
jgi:hypothetical protein